jgi:hypothetical protein
MVKVKDLKIGAIIRLKSTAHPFRTDGKKVPEKYIPGLWVIDELPETKKDCVNINRDLTPYPGAYCSNIQFEDIECIV